jgi:adenylate cyclase
LYGRDVAEIDFEAEGLLEGVEGEAREARLALLRELAEDGVSLEDLRRAVEEDRLALLPVENVLGGEARYTARKISEISGVEVEALQRQLRALGAPAADLEERVFTEDDLEAARRAKAFREAGLLEEGMLEVARVLGISMAQIAAASRAHIAEAFLRPGDTELDLGRRYAQAARVLRPLLGPMFSYVFDLQLREQIRQDVIGRAELESGRLAGSADVTVAFADMVGFTRLGERLAAEEVGEVATRLWEMASEAANPPVRLVKMIGDAAMLVSTETEPALASALALVEAAERDETVPPLRAGVATGAALARGGDWYGRPVNLAARITGIARPSSVLAAAEVRQAIEDGDYRWSRVGRRRFKGIKGDVELYRARRG